MWPFKKPDKPQPTATSKPKAKPKSRADQLTHKVKDTIDRFNHVDRLLDDTLSRARTKKGPAQTRR